MKKKKILVITDDMPWGHRSIAKAIYNYLLNNQEIYDVELAQVKTENLGGNPLYTFAYRFFPSMGKIAYTPGFKKPTRDLIIAMSKLNSKRLIRVVNKSKPDLIISTYFLIGHCLENMREEMNFDYKLWNVIADPWTINPVSFVEGADFNLVYDEIGEKVGRKLGIDAKKIVKTGWWVRPEMYEKSLKQESERKQVREELGIYDDRPVVFVGGGSLGTLALARFLPILLMTRKKVAVIFNCGTDKMSYAMVESYIKTIRNLFGKKDTIIIKNFGWIEDMAKMISISDIVFGKAGPNFVFDTIAIGKPFVSITHIGGQEDGNIEIIKKKKLGWVKEDNGSLISFFKNYLKKPLYFNQKYKKSISLEAKKNKESLPKILELVRKELN